MYPEFNNEEKNCNSTNSSETEAFAESSSNFENEPETQINSFNSTSVENQTLSEENSIKKEEPLAALPETSSEEIVFEGSLNGESEAYLENEQDSGAIDEVIPNVSSVGNYLFYGGKDVPNGINYKDTLNFLVEKLKYDGGELSQARQKKDGSGIITPDEKTSEVCSYCGLPISGVDYYRLPDGRKRCPNCNRSLVKSLEELNTIFNDVLLNLELFFGAVIDVPISVEMLEERKLKKKIGKGLGNPPKNVLILGVAVERKGKYTVYVENGIPRTSLIATLAHELTHIWQYTHWNAKNIKKQYGSKMRLVVYEGMAMWTEIQYLYHVGEQNIAKREEILTLARNDEYGVGFTLYADQYPLATETKAIIETPFSAGENPIDLNI